MPTHPLAEIFGFPPDNFSPTAEYYRQNCLCPYNNKVATCTKDKANNPLGVCSVYEGNSIAITCPVRFRQDWLIAEDASKFFFDETTSWTALTEVRINDKNGKSAGNIDVVLVAYDKQGKAIDFGCLEVQAVYISGNVRQPFEHYMNNPEKRANMNWQNQPNYPRPDYVSSSRKRLAPQLLYKGSICQSWGKKQAIAIHQNFYQSLPQLPEVEKSESDLAWLIYGLQLNSESNYYQLTKIRTVYTKFQSALAKITIPDIGDMENFYNYLQIRLNQKLTNN